MASKPAVKTYSRSHARETVATRAFDEAFSAKQNAAAVPIKAAPTKWGKTSFCRVRDDDPFQTTYKKVKIENETMDPFTFDYDDESGQIKSEPVITPSAPSTSTTSNNGNTNSSTSTSSTNQAGMTFGGLGRPAIPHMKVQKTPVEPTVVIENEENETVVESQPSFRRPIRTYSRASKKEQSQVPDQQVSLSEPMEAEVLVHSEPATQESDVFSSQERPSRVNEDIFGDDDEDEPPPVLRKETTRTYGGRTRGRGAGKAVKVPSQRTSSKTHLLQSLDDENAKTTVLNFRSHFMDPAVYSQFEYTPSGEDPIGRLHNSKVLQKSEVKHGKGSTLIVVCSPKPVPEGKLKQSPVIGAREKEASVRASELIKSTKETVEFSENEFSEFDSPIRYKGEKREKHPFVEPSSKRTKLDTTTKQQAVVKQVKNDNITQKPVSNKTPSETETKRVTRNSSNTQPRKNKIFRSRNKELATEEESTKESQELQSEEKTPVVNETKTEKVEQVSKDTADSTKENTSKKSNNNNADLSENSFGFEDGSSQDDSQKSGKEDENSETPTSSQDTNVDNSSQEGGGGTDVEMLESSQESLPNSQSSSEGQSSSQEITSKKKASQSLILSKESKDRKIFKSRNKNSDVQRKIFQSPKKSPSKAVYNVRSWQADFDEEDRSGSSGDESQPPKLQPITKQVPQFEEDDKQAEPPRLVRAMHWPKQDDAYTSVHVTKQHKELYTVVKNVKEAHECQEYGETQEYIDDVEYLLDGLQDKQPMSTRCLSCIGIAQKCIIPAFRMHLRAHGIITKIFGSVQDACSDPSLALCTSLVMFMLSRDRLNMDLDDQSVTLMLSLLGVDNQEISASMTAAGKRALNRNKDRVKEVYEQLQKELQKEGKPKLPELEFVSTGNLAMESLLSLTSKSAGEWFKEELRKHGALDHIVDTVCSCIEVVSDDTTLLTDSTIENIKKVDRCLRVLENVTFTNEENQQYLISYKQSGLIKSVCSALYTCEQCLPIYPLADLEKVDKESTGYVIYSCILAILRMLLNITHGNEFACQKVGEQNVFIDTTLVCILQTPQYVPLDFRFDVLVLSLGLLINLVEHCEVNRRRLIEAYATPSYELNTSNTVSIPAIKALVQLFCHRFEVANKMEEQDFKEPSTPSHSPDKSGEWRESDSGIEWVVDSAKKDGSTVEEPPKNSRNSNDLKNSNPNNLDDEETFTKALHRAGKHMENSIVASYVGLLLGCLIQDNSDFVEKVKKQLPSGNFEDMIAVLKKFLAFMNFTSVIGSGGTGGKSIAHVIEVLEAC